MKPRIRYKLTKQWHCFIHSFEWIEYTTVYK